MPTWFQNQIQKAFLDKNLHQIRLLNQCWYFYRKKHCAN
ncbi:cortex morphogenetic protein CmpA [Bacillus sp. FJAT-50079]|nr:cortex morphogenetic protein CmpA [Bacillus sp. FJAT-50079]MBS4206464.1 cortex morphogenetic protein CmpA [Bacillus sp. FJAT-50079]